MFLKITLKCTSLRMFLDLLNQILNVDAIWSFHCRTWQSWNVEVNVLHVDCTVELVVRIEWRNVTTFFRSKLFFHYVCAWGAWLHRLPCSTVSMLNTNVFRQFLRFPRSIWRTKFFVQTLFIDLVGTGRFSGFWLGQLGERCMLNFSTRLLNEFTDWLLFNCRAIFIIPSSPIVIVSQWDLWWWSRR